jgi:hypothetical protein
MAEMKRTQFAMKALSLSEMFQAVVGIKPLEGAVKYRVELAAPEGPSTGGGTQAVQHINLIPENGGPTVVAGSANQKDKSGLIRTYDRLVEQHARRFKGTPFTIEQPTYDQLAARIQKFLANQGFQITQEDAEQKLVYKQDAQEQILEKIKSSAQVSQRGAGTPASGSFRNVVPKDNDPPLAPASSGTPAGFQSFTSAPQPSVPKPASKVWLWVGVGIGLAGLGTGLLIALSGR